jgi:mandelate racemase
MRYLVPALQDFGAMLKGRRLEWQDWADPVVQKPCEIRDGVLHIPDVPGVGLEWNEDVVVANLADL